MRWLFERSRAALHAVRFFLTKPAPDVDDEELEEEIIEYEPAPLWQQITIGATLAIMAFGYAYYAAPTKPRLTDESIAAAARAALYSGLCDPAEPLTLQGWRMVMAVGNFTPQDRIVLPDMALDARRRGRDTWCVDAAFAGAEAQIKQLNAMTGLPVPRRPKP